MEVTVKRAHLSPMTSLLVSFSFVVGILVVDLTKARIVPAAEAQGRSHSSGAAVVSSLTVASATIKGKRIIARGVVVNGVATDGVVVSGEVALADGVVGSGEIITTDGVDRKSTRLNSSHANISYAVFCLKKKKKKIYK